MIKRLLMTKVLADSDNTLKIVLIITAAALMPFMILISIIGAAASSVNGFFNPDSGEEFDPEKFKTSEVVTVTRTWYEAYLSEYESTMNIRKAEVEKENTTIERIEKPKSDSVSPESAEPGQNIESTQQAITVKPRIAKKQNDKKFSEIAIDGTEDNPSRPSDSQTGTSSDSEETDTGEENGETDVNTEVEEIEVCHVNVIISMGEIPLSAILAYYNLLAINQLISGESFKVPSQEQINEMLTLMTVYEEQAADDSDDYYLLMSFKNYEELPETMFATWELSDEEHEEYSDIYLNVTQMVAGWIDEDLSLFENEESNGEEETDGKLQ